MEALEALYNVDDDAVGLPAALRHSISPPSSTKQPWAHLAASVAEDVFDFCILDEAHNVKNNMTHGWVSVNNLNCRVIGLTATPTFNIT